MRLQSAIFDMDGTLLDSMPIWRDLGTSVLRGLGIEPEPETDEMPSPSGTGSPTARSTTTSPRRRRS